MNKTLGQTRGFVTFTFRREKKNCWRGVRRFIVGFLFRLAVDGWKIFILNIAVSWKLVAAAVNGTLAGVVVLLFATEFCILNCLFICPPLARG